MANSVLVPRNPFQPFLLAPLASQRLICDHYASESKYSSVSHLPTGCNGQDICIGLSQEGAPVTAASLAIAFLKLKLWTLSIISLMGWAQCPQCNLLINYFIKKHIWLVSGKLSQTYTDIIILNVKVKEWS